MGARLSSAYLLPGAVNDGVPYAVRGGLEISSQIPDDVHLPPSVADVLDTAGLTNGSTSVEWRVCEGSIAGECEYAAGIESSKTL